MEAEGVKKDIIRTISTCIVKRMDRMTSGRYISNLTTQDGSAFERQYEQAQKAKNRPDLVTKWSQIREFGPPKELTY